MLKVIIAGSRNFNDYQKLKETLDLLLEKYKDQEIEIVSGTAKGADKLGEKYAEEKGFKVKKFPANWDEFGKKAGFLRNEDMAKYASHAVIFWDGVSKGSKHMISLCEKYKLKFRVYCF